MLAQVKHVFYLFVNDKKLLKIDWFNFHGYLLMFWSYCWFCDKIIHFFNFKSFKQTKPNSKVSFMFLILQVHWLNLRWFRLQWISCLMIKNYFNGEMLFDDHETLITDIKEFKVLLVLDLYTLPLCKKVDEVF